LAAGHLRAIVARIPVQLDKVAIISDIIFAIFGPVFADPQVAAGRVGKALLFVMV